MVIDTPFVSYFVNPNLGVEILFHKERAHKKGALILK